jgi:hypothetical protein
VTQSLGDKPMFWRSVKPSFDICYDMMLCLLFVLIPYDSKKIQRDTFAAPHTTCVYVRPNNTARVSAFLILMTGRFKSRIRAITAEPFRIKYISFGLVLLEQVSIKYSSTIVVESSQCHGIRKKRCHVVKVYEHSKNVQTLKITYKMCKL